MTITVYPVQALFNVQQRRRYPSLLLIAVPPAVHLVSPLADQGVDGLNHVRRREALPKLLGHAQTMEGEGLLEAFFQAGHRRLINQPKLLLDRLEGCLSLSVAILRICPAHLIPEGRLQIGSEVVHHVLPFMPLAPLDDPMRTENILNGFPEAFCAVNDAQ